MLRQTVHIGNCELDTPVRYRVTINKQYSYCKRILLPVVITTITVKNKNDRRQVWN